MVWGTACGSSALYKTEFVKKFKVVPKFWSKVWSRALRQPVAKRSMAKTDFCELLDITSQQTFPQNFGTTWNFFANLGLIVAELWLTVPLTSCGLYSTYILSTRRKTKCTLSFWVGCTSALVDKNFPCRLVGSSCRVIVDLSGGNWVPYYNKEMWVYRHAI